MRILVATLIVLLLVPLVATLAQNPSDPFRPVGTLLELMRGVVLPAANGVFDAGNEPPIDDEGWLKAQNAGLAVAEVGNLLMIPGRDHGRRIAAGEVKLDDDWDTLALALIDAGESTYKAALARDADALLFTGGDLVEACDACHMKYRDVAE